MTNDNNDSLEEYYRARAPEYEEIYRRRDAARQAELEGEAESLTGLVRGKAVLELACGTGYWTGIMSQSAASIVASDLAPEMLVEAKKKDFGCPVSFVPADMFGHSFGEHCFDVVALGFWFSHQPRQEYESLFDTLLRPLKHGGLIWMIDNNPRAEAPLPTSCRVDSHGNNYKERSLSNGETFVVLKNYFERSELEAIFAPRFEIKALTHRAYYWSAILSPGG